ncbi:MAG: ABC transporter ATP-binding protein [Geminicoccaceae bacterium]
MLEVEGVSKSFDTIRAVRDVSLAVQSGQIAGLIGPNGAGKTTLFNTVAGLHRPDRGAIRLDGRSIVGLEPHAVFRAGLTRTFQIPRPFPEMTVLENVMLVPGDQAGERFWNNWLAGGRVRAQERQIREQARELIAFCGLGQVTLDLARTLSGGQLKLLELARALMADPKIVLLDEPAAGINPALMEVLVEKILALNARGHAFLIIEHNMDLVMSICDPLMVMAGGELIFSGPAEAARRDPRVVDAYLGDLPS